MKTIFVTIDEFLSKGGILEEGRMIYREELRQFDSEKYNNAPMLECHLQLGQYVRTDYSQKVYIVSNSSFTSLPISGTLGYVKIQCTPEYK